MPSVGVIYTGSSIPATLSENHHPAIITNLRKNSKILNGRHSLLYLFKRVELKLMTGLFSFLLKWNSSSRLN